MKSCVFTTETHGMVFAMPKKPDTVASRAKAEFAARLKMAREGSDYRTMKDFALALELEAETYRAYERGENEPPLWVLSKIHKTTGVSLDFLIAGVLPRAESSTNIAARQ